MWAQLSDEQKDCYGEEYFEASLRSLEKYTSTVSGTGKMPAAEWLPKTMAA